MIFVTLGSQKFQFNRLLHAVDDLIENKLISDDVFAQTGYSDYLPKHYPYQVFLDRDAFNQMIDRSEIVITHGGTGAVVSVLKKKKKVIAIPRLAQYGEHVDDHQVQLISQFQAMNLICVCSDCAKLTEALDFTRQNVFQEYVSNTNAIIHSIDTFIQGGM
ncbi:MAG: PssE/Cps14G family polysaccharide biosynthesis glycosyltransferase [Oscillospiraceae bacterium]